MNAGYLSDSLIKHPPQQPSTNLMFFAPATLNRRTCSVTVIVGLLSWIVSSLCLADTIFYDASGRIIGAAQGNGLICDYAHDEEGNVMSAAFSSTDTTDMGGAGNGIADWWENFYFDERGIDPLGRDDDGIPFLLKFALGLTPGEDSSFGLPQFALGEGEASLAFRKGKFVDDLEFVVQSSPDLDTWTDWEDETLALFDGPPLVGLGDELADVFQLTLPYSGSRFFMRLWVRQP